MKKAKKICVEYWDIDGKFHEYVVTCSSKANCLDKLNQEFEFMRRLKADGEILEFSVTATM